MMKNVDVATNWLQGLADKGVKVRERDGNLEMSPRSAFGTLTDSEMLALDNYYLIASIKSLVRSGWQPAAEEKSELGSDLNEETVKVTTPQGGPSPQAPIDKAGTSFAPQTSPGEAVPALEASKPADLNDATALDFGAKEKATPSLSHSPISASESEILSPSLHHSASSQSENLKEPSTEPPDPERAARLRVVHQNTDEEIKRRNAIAISVMLHGVPRGHRDWS